MTRLGNEIRLGDFSSQAEMERRMAEGDEQVLCMHVRLML